MAPDPDEVWRNLGGRPPPPPVDRRRWPPAAILFAVLIVPTLFLAFAYAVGRLMRTFE